MKIISVVGARPNFMKIAPFVHAIEAHNQRSEVGGQRSEVGGQRSEDGGRRSEDGGGDRIEHTLVHTGQHYDERMSKGFFDALNIPRPDIDLEIGSGSHAEQVGRTMIEFEKVVREHQPDWVIVVGDVNATCACSITAKKEHVRLAHIEAGLRSFDLEMPEEINRMVTDRLSDLLFTTDEIASRNLRSEGVAEERIKFVGNIMIDTLEAHRGAAGALDLAEILRSNSGAGIPVWEEGGGRFPPMESGDESCRAGASGRGAGGYAVMTMHRPSNVDRREVLEPVIDFLLTQVCVDSPLIWPIHPRAEKQLKAFGLWERVVRCENLILLHPVGYHEMLRLNMGARLMLTDSGGLQEECCVLGTPCMTLRWNTERPVTLREHGGASVLVGNAVENLRREYETTKAAARAPQRPPLWDGHTAERIVAALLAM